MISPASTMLKIKSQTKTLHEIKHQDSKPPRGEIILYQNGLPIRFYSLTKDIIRIGSALDNEICLKDPYVSAHHSLIERRGELYFLIDQKSRNGTLLNHLPVKETGIPNKAQITIGKSILQFKYHSESPQKTSDFEGMISKNLIMQELFHLIQKVALLKETVMIYGETGTGKELVAKALHQRSPRHHLPLITVNCGAIPKDLLESELFGHLKGSFTGAHEDKLGSFQAAHGGTLFLDEIGELPLALQPKLLRALEYGEIKPIGAEKVQKVNVRIISATHRNLPQMIQEKTFREDLFYRLHLIPLYLPSLRDRKEDIPLLIQYQLKDTQITSKALRLLIQHNWPGNIRELKNVLERIKLYMEGPVITEREVQRVLKTELHSFRESIKYMERDLIRDFLEKNQWNKAATARALLMPKSTLLDKIKQYQLQQ